MKPRSTLAGRTACRLTSETTLAALDCSLTLQGSKHSSHRGPVKADQAHRLDRVGSNLDAGRRLHRGSSLACSSMQHTRDGDRMVWSISHRGSTQCTIMFEMLGQQPAHERLWPQAVRRLPRRHAQKHLAAPRHQPKEEPWQQAIEKQPA